MKGRNVLFSSRNMDHITPPEIFEPLNDVFQFRLDPCTAPDNPLGTEKYYASTGLTRNWPPNYSAYVNPPYNRIDMWVNKVVREYIKHPECDYVMLLPSRTDRPWFAKLVEEATAITFVNKRIRFYEKELDELGYVVGKKRQKACAPFPSVIALFASGPNVVSLKAQQVLESFGKTWYSPKTIFERTDDAARLKDLIGPLTK